MVYIETDRLIIRNFILPDGAALFALITQYGSTEYAAYDQPWPASAEQIREATQWFASGDHFLAVCLKEPRTFIGLLALNPDATGGRREFNLGYIFNADYHGQGYASEAGRAVLARAFEQLKADRVVAGTAAANTASCALLERLGLKKINEARSSFRKTADGHPIEFLGYTYAITREEWQAREHA
jgi:RimJ/RimL family protein N-acetyltransferase